jgi:hypothetical protein
MKHSKTFITQKLCYYNEIELHFWMKVIEVSGKWALSMLKRRYLVWKNEEKAAKFLQMTFAYLSTVLVQYLFYG